MPAEVYSWVEGNLFVYTAAAGQTGAPLAFLQSLRLDDQQVWDRKLSPATGRMAQRVTYSLRDQPVVASFRAYFTAMSLYRMYKSATAVNADIQLLQQPALGSAAWRCLSGRFNAFLVNGQDGGIWEADIEMQFAEASALWGQ